MNENDFWKKTPQNRTRLVFNLRNTMNQASQALPLPPVWVTGTPGRIITVTQL